LCLAVDMYRSGIFLIHVVWRSVITAFRHAAEHVFIVLPDTIVTRNTTSYGTIMHSNTHVDRAVAYIQRCVRTVNIFTTPKAKGGDFVFVCVCVCVCYVVL